MILEQAPPARVPHFVIQPDALASANRLLSEIAAVSSYTVLHVAPADFAPLAAALGCTRFMSHSRPRSLSSRDLYRFVSTPILRRGGALFSVSSECTDGHRPAPWITFPDPEGTRVMTFVAVSARPLPTKEIQ